MAKSLASTTLSIIIPTWNTARVTLNCVQSLLTHPASKGWQIIVVDNHSTDNTSVLFKSISGVSYQALDQNYGYAYACNIGARQATGPYLLFLNSDMQLVSGLDSMLNFLVNHPQVGLVGPQFLNPDGTLQGSVFPPQSIKNAFLQFWLHQSTYSKFSPIATRPLNVWALSGGAVLAKKSILSEIGWWDTRYHMYYEDLELCRQIRRHGFQIIYFPGCQFTHRHGASGSHLANPANQWRRLISSSKLYHGLLRHYFLNFVIWSGQKLFP